MSGQTSLALRKRLDPDGLTGTIFDDTQAEGVRILVRDVTASHIHVRMCGGNVRRIKRSKWGGFISRYARTSR